MWHLLQRAHTLLGNWVLDNINLYADDFHISDMFLTAARFEHSITRLGAFLDLIESTGLVINLAKTQMLLRPRGLVLHVS